MCAMVFDKYTGEIEDVSHAVAVKLITNDRIKRYTYMGMKLM